MSFLLYYKTNNSFLEETGALKFYPVYTNDITFTKSDMSQLGKSNLPSEQKAVSVSSL